jgi:hypothetical protein
VVIAYVLRAARHVNVRGLGRRCSHVQRYSDLGPLAY